MPDEWQTKKCLYLSLAILLSNLGLTGLAALGFNIPILRQIVGFAFLTFIPGILILRILKVHNLGIMKTTLYSVGLSVAFVMFSGLLMNTLFPHIGITKPISTLPVTATLAILTIVLCIIAYIRDKDFQPSKKNQAEERKLPLSPILFLVLIPLLASLGALLVTGYRDNTLLLVLITTIAFVPVLIVFNKFISWKLYPMAVVSISLALLLHQTLISPYLTGWDIHGENYYQGLVLVNGYWDPLIASNLNAMLSITMLCPIYSLVLGMDSIWIFKIIYPFIYCLVPLAIFEVCEKQIGGKRTFLATFFFMSMLVFFTEMTALARQQVAELFFVLLILLTVDRTMSQLQKKVLAVIFAISLPVSHYGLAYICLAFFAVAWLLLKLMENKTLKSWWTVLTKKFSPLLENPGIASLSFGVASVPFVLTGTLILLYIVFLLCWYMYISSGSAFNTIIGIGNSIYSNLYEFFSPTARETLIGTALGIDFARVSALGKSFRLLQYITQFLIVVGLLRSIIKPEELKFRSEYFALSIVAGLILLFCILLPYFSSFLNVTRFYHISLITLSPFCILGGEALWQWLKRLFKPASIWLKAKQESFALTKADPVFSNNNFVYPFIALFVLIPYFLFNTGFIFEVSRHEYTTGDVPSSMALSNHRVDYSDYYWKEATGAKWLASNYHGEAIVYGDEYTRVLLGDWLRGVLNYTRFPSELENVPGESYIFLREWNILHREVFLINVHEAQVLFERVKIEDCPPLLALLDCRDVIYDNSGAQIFAPK